MRVRILQGLSGAEQATGLAVVIDVFRAFTTALFVSANGAERIVPIASEARARAFKAADPKAVLMGERDCIKLAGFDYGNSPADIEQIDFRGRTVIQTTSAGTQGLEAAALRSEAAEVVTGSFANAGAIVRYIRQVEPEEVTLVALGTAGIEPAPEDTMCAMYLKNELEDFPNRFEALKRFLATVETAAKFFDPAKEYAPERDFELCLDLDRFDFVLRAEQRPDGFLELHRMKTG